MAQDDLYARTSILQFYGMLCWQQNYLNNFLMILFYYLITHSYIKCINSAIALLYKDSRDTTQSVQYIDDVLPYTNGRLDAHELF